MQFIEACKAILWLTLSSFFHRKRTQYFLRTSYALCLFATSPSARHTAEWIRESALQAAGTISKERCLQQRLNARSSQFVKVWLSSLKGSQKAVDASAHSGTRGGADGGNSVLLLSLQKSLESAVFTQKRPRKSPAAPRQNHFSRCNKSILTRNAQERHKNALLYARAPSRTRGDERRKKLFRFEGDTWKSKQLSESNSENLICHCNPASPARCHRHTLVFIWF